MADPDQVARLKEGAQFWNYWRTKNLDRRIDLGGADLAGTKLVAANLVEANLCEARLSHAILDGAELAGANLGNADLTQASLAGAQLLGAGFGNARLGWANLSRAHLAHAFLFAADLSYADLSGANLTGADLSKANLLGANLDGANLRSARLQAAILDRANLTGIRLWETQRGGWSIKGVLCEQAYWDKAGQVPTPYSPGEFEKLYSDHLRVELFYQGGINTFELNTLPALLHRLTQLHPACGIRLRSVEQTGGGARVLINVEDADQDTLDKIKVEAEKSQSAQIALRHDSKARWEIEKRLLLDDVFPRILAAVGNHVQTTNVVHATNVIIASDHASVNAHQTTNDPAHILKLLNEVMDRSAQLGHAKDEASELEDLVQTVKQELRKSDPKPSIISRGLEMIEEIALKLVTTAGETALKASWQPLLYELHKLIP